MDVIQHALELLARVEAGQHRADLVAADLEGTFVYTIVLPSDLPAGEYSIRGVTDHHDVISPTFTVQGSAVSNEASGREERDALLAPVPTYAPGVVPGVVSRSTSVASPTSEETPDFRGSSMLLLGLSILLGLAAFLVFRNRVVAKS